MATRWKKTAGMIATGLLVVGCSMFSQQAKPGPGVPEAPAAEPQPDRVLRPGPGPVTVEAIAPTTARVAWKSPWSGDSVVRFAPNAELDKASSATTFGQAVTLKGLAPKTRYFFRVETRTKLGLARSSTLSFKTR